MRTTWTIAVAGALLLTSCSGSPDNNPTAPPVPVRDGRIARLVPQQIKADGVLTIATDPTYPPMESLTPDGKLEGADIDLAAGMATVMGLEPKFEQEAFTAIASDVRTGKYEVGIAALTLRPGERMLNNAVIYLRAGSQLVRNAAAPALTLSTLCGQDVAAIEGSVQIEQLVRASKQCRASGKKSVDIAPFADQTSATEAVLSGAAGGFLADSPVSQDIVSRFPGRLELASNIYDVRPMGVLTAAESAQLTRALRASLQALIDNGYYSHVLNRWNIDRGAVDIAEIRWADSVREAQARARRKEAAKKKAAAKSAAGRQDKR